LLSTFFEASTLCIKIPLRFQLVPDSKSVILAPMLRWNGWDPLPQKFHGGSVTIGNFDGLHLGHQALFRKARETAGSGPVSVITFDPHPQAILHPGSEIRRIFPREDLVEQLPRFGVDLLAILEFTPEMAKLTADEFWSRYVSGPLKPKHVIAGHDFAFGKDRTGTLDFLKAWGKNNSASVHVVEPLKLDGEIVSSRLIRELILQGQVSEARRRLGRPFYLRGEVGRGAGRGKTIGVPTMNFTSIRQVIPKLGVYATRTLWEGCCLASVTNVGVNPTFGGDHLKVETHVLNQHLDARGKTVQIEFIERLREERKFPGIEDLKKQIKEDILKAQGVLNQYEALDVAQSKQ
jgi:riboflavin kinase/FMN adenylyltransferase